MKVIAYTYEADHHCIPCTLARFDKGPWAGREEAWVDDEGNRVHAMFDSEEWYANDVFEGNATATLGCGTCGEVIERLELELA